MSGWGKRGTSSPIISVCHLNEPLAFAGLWEVWEDKNTVAEPHPYKSCTIITMEASDSVKDIHNRMPLILKPDVYDEWLGPENKEPGIIEEVLKNGCVKELKRYPVSKLVNHAGNNSEECMKPLTDIGGPESLESAPKKA